jgi:predicted nucleic acid-binding protein
MAEIVYWDACIFIELLQQADQDRFDACEDLRRRAAHGDLQIVTSALTITEVNKLPDSGALPETQSQMILDFFENPYITIRSVDRAIAEYAHQLTRTHGLTNFDAIHLATALLIKPQISVLYTYDGCGQKPRRKSLLKHNRKLGDPPLRIEIPPDPSKGTLFEKKDAQKNTASGKQGGTGNV